MSSIDNETLEALLGYDLHDSRGELCRTSDYEDQSWGMSIPACEIIDTTDVVKSLARELLAHRRASHAAPAPQKPVAWAETDHKGKVIGVSMNQYPWHPTPLYAAPAPSDGLREAVEAERERIAVALETEADLLPCAEDAAVTRSNAALIRADFSYEDADRAALSAPAQEVKP